MLSALIIIFVITYAAITLEHSIKINKSATALLGAGLLWTIYAVSTGDHLVVGHQLSESIASTAEIVFFLIGAMTIVEVIDTCNGFEVITTRIKTAKLTSSNSFHCNIGRRRGTFNNYKYKSYLTYPRML
jgi:Na+/H+ antiporter NhaD/arsenite permease-like protein